MRHRPYPAPEGVRTAALATALLALAAAASARAQSPVTTCDTGGIGAAQLDADGPEPRLMAVIGKQLVEAIYGRPPEYAYWNGCSTGGRQGLRMAPDFPNDYDGILAGAPAIHWDRFQAGHIWYQVVQLRDNGGPIDGPCPAEARWDGEGSSNDAANFVCAE